jgi:hypothetical protein
MIYERQFDSWNPCRNVVSKFTEYVNSSYQEDFSLFNEGFGLVVNHIVRRFCCTKKGAMTTLLRLIVFFYG